MTEVCLTRGEETNRVRVKGHQDGQVGQDIYCAAVSAMCMMLINALRAEGARVVEETIRGGDVRLEAERTPRVDAFYDMLAAGMRSMEAVHPGRVLVRGDMGNG